MNKLKMTDRLAAPPCEVKHLLLLDDEPNVLSSLRRSLRRADWSIHITTSPQEALEILVTYRIGVVLSDQLMPKIFGTEFLRQVENGSAKGTNPSVRPFRAGVMTDAIKEGAIWKFLSKPWDNEVLREQIRLGFAEHAAMQGAPSESG